MTYEQAEAKARRLSMTGFGLKMWQTSDGWAWQWLWPASMAVTSGSTTAATKAVALIMALEEIP